MPTIAESPPVTYSKPLAALGSTQPVPVVVTTRRCCRSKPPARSRSATASAACCSVSSALASPVKMRIGSIAGRSVSSVICSAVGPLPTKVRPSTPMPSQSTSDASLPERSGVDGRSTPSGVSRSPRANDASSARSPASAATPLSSAHATKPTDTTPRTRATEGRRRRSSSRATRREAARAPRARPRNSAATTTVTSGTRSTNATGVASVPARSWASACHRTPAAQRVGVGVAIVGEHHPRLHRDGVVAAVPLLALGRVDVATRLQRAERSERPRDSATTSTNARSPSSVTSIPCALSPGRRENEWMPSTMPGK